MLRMIERLFHRGKGNTIITDRQVSRMVTPSDTSKIKGVEVPGHVPPDTERIYADALVRTFREGKSYMVNLTTGRIIPLRENEDNN